MLRQASLLFGRRLPATRCLLTAGVSCKQLPFGSCLVAKQGLSIRGMSSANDMVDRQGAYEGAGKTTVSILNQEIVGINLIDSYSSDGFRLTDDTFIFGPAIILPTAVLRWNIMSAAEITMESLSLFTILEPKLDVIVIGHGCDPCVRDPVNIKTILGLKKKGIAIESIPTEKAIATYNYLLEEGRVVAAALIPPAFILNETAKDIVSTKLAQKELYKESENVFVHSSVSKKKFLREERANVRAAYKVVESGKVGRK